MTIKRTPLNRGKGLLRGTPMTRVALARTPRARAPRRRSKRPEGFPWSVRELVLARCAGLCEVCGERPVEQLHHRRARGSGGSRRESTNLASNALATCIADHARIESHRSWALVHGWLVNQSHDPAQVPVLLHHGWVLLDESGRFHPSDRPDHEDVP